MDRNSEAPVVEVKIQEGPKTNDFISLHLHENEGGENALSIPILRPEDNILFADICNLGLGIIGIGYQTDSGSRIKVGFQDSSMEKLRYQGMVLNFAFYDILTIYGTQASGQKKFLNLNPFFKALRKEIFPKFIEF